MNGGLEKVLLATTAHRTRSCSAQGGRPGAGVRVGAARGACDTRVAALHYVREDGGRASVLEEDSGKARELLNGEVERIEGLGGKVAKAHLERVSPARRSSP